MANQINKISPIESKIQEFQVGVDYVFEEIKLTNEMRESNGNLGESTSDWYNAITQIEVPTKQHCKIM